MHSVVAVRWASGRAGGPPANGVSADASADGSAAAVGAALSLAPRVGLVLCLYLVCKARLVLVLRFDFRLQIVLMPLQACISVVKQKIAGKA